MATPLRSLPRSASARADQPSPFSSNRVNQPVTAPNTPAASAAAASSFGCMTATPTDTPPDTPKDGKTKEAPAVMSATAFAVSWSPRRLMQRAARAFRSSRSPRRRMKKFNGREEPAAAVTRRVSDAASAGSLDNGGNNNSVVADDKMQGEVVPEKIIHVANHQAPPVVKAEACDTEKTADEDEEPKKGAVAVLEAAVADDNANMADKFCMVVKEAMKKHEEEADDTKEEAMRRFQGSRVKTAMEARAESEQPRRREVARSNDVIEEACTKLLAKRQGSRVRALVGAFETVMDDAKPAAAGKPQHHHCKSV